MSQVRRAECTGAFDVSFIDIRNGDQGTRLDQHADQMQADMADTLHSDVHTFEPRSVSVCDSTPDTNEHPLGSSW